MSTEPTPPPTSSPPPPPQLTVAGVTFTAEQIVSAVVKIDDREIYITKKEDQPKTITGFKP